MNKVPASRRTILASMTMAASLALSGCGLGGSAGQPTELGVTGQITFQTWNLRPKYADYFSTLISQFQQQHPGTRIKWVDQPSDGYSDKVSAQAAAGVLPDVVNVTPDMVWSLYRYGLLLDLDKATSDAENYVPGAWQGFVMPGQAHSFAFPWYLNTGPLYYNTKLFSETGLDPQRAPRTYEQLADQALVLAARTNGRVAMTCQLPTLVDFGLYGVQLMNSTGTRFTFNSDKGVRLLELFKKMYDGKAIPPEALTTTTNDCGKRFTAQQIALTVGNAYDLQSFKTEAPGLIPNLGITDPISNTGRANLYMHGLSVAADSPHQATAIAFAQFVTNAPNQLSFAKAATVFPSSTGSLRDPFFAERDGTDIGRVRVAAARQLHNAVNYSPPVATTPMNDLLRDAVVNTLLGRVSAKEALDTVVAECNKLLADP